MDGYAIIPADQEQSVIAADWSAGVLSDELEMHENSADFSPQLAEEQNQLYILGVNEMPINDTGSASDSDGSSENETDKEPGKYFYPGFEELVNPRPPEVGMRFPTLEDANRYYSAHALLTGFVAIRGPNFMRKKFHIECNRSRKLAPSQDLKRKREVYSVNKAQCEARVVVKPVKGQWEYTTVRSEHNHPLCPSPSLTRFFLSCKHMSAEERSFLRALQQSSIHPKKAMKIFKRMRGILGNLPFKTKDANTSQCAEQQEKPNSDVETTVNHLKELELQNPFVSFTTQIDEDSVVRSLFWTDARSRIDYEIFGDVLSFDTTYSTNKHNMPFTSITGMNGHGRTLVFGCALLQDKKAETFKWMFQTFLHVMGGEMPRAIVTDQDEAIKKAISEVMPQVKHRFCKFHVMRKAREKLGGFIMARGNINSELDALVNNSLTEKEFEEGWATLIERYSASGNEYLQLLWETRREWVPVYFREDFYPFAETTGCCEGANLLFKDYVLPKDRIEKFLERYEDMQERIIRIDDEDRLQSRTEPSCFSMQPIEKHAAHIYTRQIFLKVQRELLHSTAFNVDEIQPETVFRLQKVSNYENPEFDRNSFELLVEPGTNAIKCECAKFTRDGIPCCHMFRLFTQFGVNEIPGQYIVPRWTAKFKEEQMKQYKEKCLGSRGMDESENTMRYAMLLSKVTDIGKEICGDGSKCDKFSLELDAIEGKIGKATEETPETDDS
ncbi:protein FAR1-RELATED SEQUENCE 9-like [Hordeum vulgare subsp. vulgare]|uniref:Protein FAR1-RELATED SEQUENCE n=1 Tax=Hordeum vulgare subsp. vulgare TaxID=112509 RepID=A0A8I6WL40_HORVV|nr:protein FAR1-RELATED SEQUENCE 9-like [Hordeum vulgare subsp. vulgare]